MISVIIPVYNVEKYVARCIESIINQTYTDTEIIVIDDGSTDNSGIICDQFMEHDNRVRVIHQENKGLSAARNAGIEMAEGEYLFFIDSDDFVELEALEILFTNLVNNKADISIGSFFYYSEGEEVREENDRKDVEVYNGERINGLLLKSNFQYNWQIVVAHNKLYKKELFQNNKYAVGKIHEDQFIIHHLLYECKILVYTNYKTYHYIQHPDGITGNINEKRIIDTLDAYSDREKFWKEKREEQLYRELQRQNRVLYRYLAMLVKNVPKCNKRKAKQYLKKRCFENLCNRVQDKNINIVELISFAFWIVFM